MKALTNLWTRSSRRRKAGGVGCLGVLALCGCLALLTSVFPSAPRTPAPAQPQRVIQPTQPPAATNTARPAPTVVDTAAPIATTPGFFVVLTQGAFSAVVVDKAISADREALTAVAKSVCGDQDICLVAIWDDASRAADVFPMTDAQVAARIAAYSFNKNTGNDQLLLCAVDGC